MTDADIIEIPPDSPPPETPVSESSQTDSKPQGLVEAISGESFDEWYREHVWAKNIREGKAFFNGPSQIHPPTRHNPSQLLKCSRKTYYDQLNAPQESEFPRGIFWVGSQLEERVILPYLSSIADEGEYVTNTIWIQFTETTDVGDIEISGATDPVLVDRDAKPLVLTEVKSKRSLDNLRQPDPHHIAQATAYLRGLTRKYESDIETAVIIYISRTSLDLTVFPIEFDEDYWTNTVLDWAETHTQYRLNEELPPASPEAEWECEYCSYRERCGKGTRTYSDVQPTGLLPLFSYPRQQLINYLEHHGGKLTPTLAHQHPDLVEEHGAYEWQCSGCGETYAWNAFEWSGDETSPPKCPSCTTAGTRRFLSGPSADDQFVRGDDR